VFIAVWAVGAAPPHSPARQSPDGTALYENFCAVCHGLRGDGLGPAAPMLVPRPRDFRDGIFKIRSTASGSLPTDEDLRRTIRYGLHGSAMPWWEDILTGDSLDAVIGRVKSFSPRFGAEIPQPVRLSTPPPVTPAGISAGASVYGKLQCASCHGSDGRGTGAVASGFTDAWGYPVPAADLTEPWTFRGGATQTDLFMRLKTGLDGTPMPSYDGAATDRELWDLTGYLLSVARRPVWDMDSAGVAAFYAGSRTAEVADPVARGARIARSRGCLACHTSASADGLPDASLLFAGGVRVTAGPYGDFFSANLTSDDSTGLGAWTDEEIRRAITTGTSRDGRRSLPFVMPYTGYANLSPEDLDDLVAFLRSLPPVVNRIPAPAPLNPLAYLWGKFKMLILKEDFAITYHPGNAGDARPGKEGVTK